jgi:hypothetical protein
MNLENYNATFIMVCHKRMTKVQLDLNFTLVLNQNRKQEITKVKVQ